VIRHRAKHTALLLVVALPGCRIHAPFLVKILLVIAQSINFRRADSTEPGARYKLCSAYLPSSKAAQAAQIEFSIPN